MKPPPFLYERATDVDHATSLLAEFGDEARILAGGQSLLPLLNLRLAYPKYLIDISKTARLSGVESDGGALVVRAGTTYREAASGGDLAVLSDAIALVGHQQIRNRGTVVGSIAHNDPSAEMPALALALDATVRLVSAAGERTLTAEEFYVSGYPFSTELAASEMVESVSFPIPGPGTAGAIAEHARRPGDYATAGVVCRVSATRGRTVAGCRIATFAGAPAVTLHQSCTGIAEGQTVGEQLWSELARVVAAEAAPTDSSGDRYLHRLYEALVISALKTAWSSASGSAS